MKRRSITSWRPSRRRGLTLVEVLAALVIMGTLLAGMVMAKARHTRQIALTQQRRAALRVADQLIAGWWGSPQGVPINARGAVDRDAAWLWETRVVENAAIEHLGARVVRVEVRAAEVQPQPLSAAPAALVAIELVLPDPERTRQAEGAAETSDE